MTKKTPTPRANGKIPFSSVLEKSEWESLQKIKKATGINISFLLGMMIKEYLENHPIE